MNTELALAGLGVGFLIGLTGVGGGSVMAPLLLALGISPVVVVGTDIGFGLLTKLVGAGVHVHQTTVDWRWVRVLAYGSVPGSVIGTLCVAHFAHLPEVLKAMIGVVLVLSAIAVAVLELARSRYPTVIDRLHDPSPTLVVVVGFVIGITVGATSVGSGSLVDMALVFFSPLAGAQLIGTGIVHAVLLSGVALTAHWRLGSIDTSLFGALMLGSVPGVLLGCRAARHAPPQPLRWGVTAIVFLSGVTTLSGMFAK